MEKTLGRRGPTTYSQHFAHTRSGRRGVVNGRCDRHGGVYFYDNSRRPRLLRQIFFPVLSIRCSCFLFIPSPAMPPASSPSGQDQHLYPISSIQSPTNHHKWAIYLSIHTPGDFRLSVSTKARDSKSHSSAYSEVPDCTVISRHCHYSSTMLAPS